MYKMCKTEQSAARQRELELGLLRAMETVHYEDISVSDLCDRLQIPRKSFYRYFVSKDGALHALLDHTLMEFDQFTMNYENNARTVQLDLERFFQFWMEHRALLDVLTRDGLTGMLIERATIYALNDEIIPRRFLQGDTQEMQQHITMFGVCGLMSMVLTWHHSGFAKPAYEMAVIAVRMLSKPLFPNADQYIL